MTSIELQPNHDPAKRRSALQTLLGSLPTFAVLLALAAVGLWGHHTGWTAPKFEAIFGSAPETAREDWCTAHNVPDSQCIACHPELTGASSSDWCKEHGVAESQCTICHPELLQTGTAADWCKEHGVPESGCTICHPEIATKGDVVTDDSEPVISAPHDEDQAGPTKPGKDPATCQKHALKVQFASKEAVDKVGVRLGKSIERPMAESMAVPAEVGYDRTRFARLVSRVPGTVRYLGKEQGEAVAAGDVLVVVDANDVGRSKAELLSAHAASEAATANEKRLEQFVAGGFRTEVERIHASTLAREAEIRLFNARQALLNLGLPLPTGTSTADSIARLGLPASVLAVMQDGSASANLLPILSPLPGVVVTRDVVRGEAVDSSRTLYEIVDPSRMWITMHVPLPMASRVAHGARVVYRPAHARDEMVSGTIDWISTEVDDVTRTLSVRATLLNPTGTLRANTFGKAQIVIRPTAKVIAVPNAAVQWEGCCHVVFVRLADTVFQTRKVRIGVRDTAYTEVLVGLLPGEIVATTGSHVLTAELLKSNLGAGCCESH